MTARRYRTRAVRVALWAAVSSVILAVPVAWALTVDLGTTQVGSPALSGAPATPEATPTVSPTTSTPTPLREKTPTTTTVGLADLGVSGTVAVAAYDLTDGDQLVAGSGSFETASVVKVDILVALLVQRSGALTTGQQALARQMITESDNDAATALFQAVGSASGLNATNAKLGLVETTAGTAGNWGLTRTTAADQVRLLRLVFQPTTLVSATSQAYVQSLMTAVDDDQDWGVPSADDDHTGYAVKNGWLPRTPTGLWDVTSIGAVQSQGHTLLVVVLVNKAQTMAGGIATIEKAATAATQRLLAA